MSNPWLKFYPSDWRADPALRMCSIAARGLWMEMLCVMHEHQGELVINGKALTTRQLATLAGCPEVDELLTELEDAGVFSRRDDGTIYSRRMIRDADKAVADKANGRKGGNPNITGAVNEGVNPEVKAQKPEARYQKPDQKEEPSGSSKKRGCRLPDGFAADLDWAVSEGLPLSQAQTEAAKFRDYWAGQPGAKGVKLDWPATWRNWVRSAIERMPKSRGSPNREPNVADGFAAFSREIETRNDPRYSTSDEGPRGAIPHLSRVQG